MQTVALGRLADYMADMKESERNRSAYKPASRNAFAGFVVKVWASRGAMLEACKMSDTGALDALVWKPCAK